MAPSTSTNTGRPRTGSLPRNSNGGGDDIIDSGDPKVRGGSYRENRNPQQTQRYYQSLTRQQTNKLRHHILGRTVTFKKKKDISLLDDEDEEKNDYTDFVGRGCANAVETCMTVSYPVLHFIQFFVC